MFLSMPETIYLSTWLAAQGLVKILINRCYDTLCHTYHAY